MHFRTSPPKDAPRLLGSIYAYFVTHSLYYLFEETIKGLLGSDSSPGARSAAMQVLKWVFEQVSMKQRSIYRVNIDEPVTYDARESGRAILEIALQDLENTRKHYKLGLPQRDREREDDRIEEDFKEFRIRVTKRFPRQHAPIKIYNMEEPTSAPRTIPAKSLDPLTSSQVVKYLEHELRIAEPMALHLWARQHGKHKLTRDEISWKYIPPDEHIEGMNLEYIKRTNTTLDYIVALTIQGNRDVPKIIDFPVPENPCCTSDHPCSGTHFARKLGESGTPVEIRNGDNIRNIIPDVDLYERRTNRLLVWCEPVIAPSGAPSQ